MKKTTFKKRICKFLILVSILSIILYCFSTKLVLDIGQAKYSGMLSMASYYAISKTVINDELYDSLITIHKDEDGKIVLITTDAYKFNKLTNTLADSVGSYLVNELDKGVEVPIGAFTGLKLFAGFGKKVNMPLITIPSIKCEIISNFESVGINQTRHSLYLNIIPEVYIVTRFKTRDLKDGIKVLLFDNYITGEVPSVYLGGNVFTANKQL